MEKTKSKSIMSWGQLFIVAGALILFLYALTMRVSFEKEKPVVPIENYVFVGSEIKSYSGTDTEIKIPTSYSYGDVTYVTGTVTFNDRWEAQEFWQENYAVGAEGYYDFYNELYTHEYPWVYEYNIGQYSDIEGDDIQITSIEWQVFANNKYVEKLTVPGTIKDLGVRSFENCPNLKEVYFEDGNEVVADGMFDGCSQLSKVRLAETTTRIDAYAFFGTALETITIPKSVKNFHIGTFYGCTKLKTVRIESPEIKANHSDYYRHFGKCPLTAIYVPYASLNYYKTTHPWSNYASLYQAIY